MQILEQCLDGLKYGRPQTHLNLTAYPLLVAEFPEPGDESRTDGQSDEHTSERLRSFLNRQRDRRAA